MNNTRELAEITGKLAYFARRDVSMAEAVRNIRMDARDTKIKEALEKVCSALDSGKPFWKALESAPPIYPDAIFEVIKAGELDEELPHTLEEAARFLMEEESMKEGIKSTLRNSILPFDFIAVIVLFVLSRFAPAFTDLFHGMSLELPLPTRFIMFLTYLFKNPMFNMIYLLILVVISIILLAPRPTENSLVFYLPLAGGLIRKFYTYHISRLTAMLVERKVDINRAVDSVISSIPLAPARKELEILSHELNSGKRFSIAIIPTKIFPGLFRWMFQKLDSETNLLNYLTGASDIYRDDILSLGLKINRASHSMFMIIMFFLMCFLIISLFLPLYQLIGKLS